MGMAIKKPVVVAALYDIGRDSWDTFNLSYNTYLLWMKNTLSLDVSMVVYTEGKFLEEITKLRSEFDPDLKNTKILEVPLENLDCYIAYYDRLSSLMLSSEFKTKVQCNVPEMNKPLYNVIMFNKVFFLKDARKFFDGDMYIWADAGGLRDNISNYSMKKWPSLLKLNELDNSKITFFSHNKSFSVHNKEYHCLSQIRNIQGTSFFVPVGLIDEFLSDFSHTVDECLSSGFIGSDEKVLDILYCKDKSKYNLIKCNWRTYFKIFLDDGLRLFDKSGNQSDSIFIDFGSHELQGLKKFISILNIDNSWELYAFEPNSKVDCADIINRDLDGYSINLYKKAIWKRSGRLVFNQYGKDGKGQGSLVEETDGGVGYGDFYGEEVVDCINALEFIESLDKNKKIYIKMDIEWSEYEVLSHMLKNWPRNIKKIWVEWHGLSNQKFIDLSKDIEKRIKLLGTEFESLNRPTV